MRKNLIRTAFLLAIAGCGQTQTNRGPQEETIRVYLPGYFNPLTLTDFNADGKVDLIREVPQDGSSPRALLIAPGLEDLRGIKGIYSETPIMDERTRESASRMFQASRDLKRAMENYKPQRR